MDWVTQGFDNQRTGWNPGETALTAANVPNLRLRFTVPVDGQIYAQPLYVSGLRFPDGQGRCTVASAGSEDECAGLHEYGSIPTALPTDRSRPH